jgi:DNA-binding XRE family transcriptional regulator
MATNVNDVIKKLSPADRKKVERRADQLIAQEMTLRELRQARKMTQADVAKNLGITQDRVSRMERGTDLLLSTLRKNVIALGGNLSLVAEFPNSGPVLLRGITGDELAQPPVMMAKSTGKGHAGHKNTNGRGPIRALAAASASKVRRTVTRSER